MMVQQDPNQVVEILLVIVDEQMVLDMIVNEPLVLDEQLVALHIVVVVEEMCRIVVVEELLNTIDCTEVDCTEVEDCYRMKHGLHVALDTHIADQSLNCAYPLLT
ncbi:hypothetical protein Tco_0708018 [Tanacetum coccineum]